MFNTNIKLHTMVYPHVVLLIYVVASKSLTKNLVKFTYLQDMHMHVRLITL